MVLVRAEINLHSHVGRAIPTLTMRLITASGVTPPIGLQLPTPEQLTTIVSGLTRHSFTLFTLFSSLSRPLITPPPPAGDLPVSPGSVSPLANYAGIGIGSLIGAAFSGRVRAVAVSVTSDR